MMIRGCTRISTSAAAVRFASTDFSKRPVSPHVTIYAFPLPAIASITNRATGVALSAGMIGVGFGCFFGDASQLPAAIESFKASAPVLVPVAKMLAAFPLVYHGLGGLRHFYWDKTAKGLDLKTVRSSSIALMGLAAAGTVLLGFTTVE